MDTNNDLETSQTAQPVSDDQKMESRQVGVARPRGNKIIWVIIVFILLTLAVLAVWFNVGGIKDKIGQDGSENAATVALVNGQKLRFSELTARVAQARTILEGQGATFETDEQLKELQNLSLENLINETLLIQEAEAQGESVRDEEVDEQYNAIAAQSGGEEQLLVELKNNDITSEKFRKNIYNQLLLRNFIQTITVGVVVGDQEVSAYYAELEGQGIELPPLEDIRTNLEYDIRQRKISESLVPIINGLREKADIDIQI
jgi:parvulin-like peptidyl-prolyl isomerase